MKILLERVTYSITNPLASGLTPILMGPPFCADSLSAPPPLTEKCWKVPDPGELALLC